MIRLKASLFLILIILSSSTTFAEPKQEIANQNEHKEHLIMGGGFLVGAFLTYLAAGLYDCALGSARTCKARYANLMRNFAAPDRPYRTCWSCGGHSDLAAGLGQCPVCNTIPRAYSVPRRFAPEQIRVDFPGIRTRENALGR